MVLAVPKCAQWSDREIAKACDVSYMLVASVRRQHLEEIPDSPALPSSRTVTRNGTTYEQNVKPRPSAAAATTATPVALPRSTCHLCDRQ